MRKYEKPSIELACFEVENILALSNVGSGNGNDFGGDLVIPQSEAAAAGMTVTDLISK